MHCISDYRHNADTDGETDKVTDTDNAVQMKLTSCAGGNTKAMPMMTVQIERAPREIDKVSARARNLSARLMYAA